VVDTSEWGIYPNFATTIENYCLYTKAKIEKAKVASEFLRNAKHPSEEEAAHLVQDGNVIYVPLTATNIQEHSKYIDNQHRKFGAKQPKVK
jgi:hypothetical protein